MQRLCKKWSVLKKRQRRKNAKTRKKTVFCTSWRWGCSATKHLRLGSTSAPCAWLIHAFSLRTSTLFTGLFGKAATMDSGWSLSQGLASSVVSSRPFLDFDKSTFCTFYWVFWAWRAGWTLVKINKLNKLNKLNSVELNRLTQLIHHDLSWRVVMVWSIMMCDDASSCVIFTMSFHGLIVFLKGVKQSQNAARGFQRCICQSDPKVLS